MDISRQKTHYYQHSLPRSPASAKRYYGLNASLTASACFASHGPKVLHHCHPTQALRLHFVYTLFSDLSGAFFNVRCPMSDGGRLLGTPAGGEKAQEKARDQQAATP